MFTLLLLLLLLDGVLMSVIVLLQAGKGGGLAAMGGGGGTMADNVIGGRQAATLLTKATWVTGGIFLALSLLLSILSSRTAGPASVLQEEFSPQPLSTPLAPPAGTGTPQIPGTEPANSAGAATGTATPPATSSTGNN